MSARIDLTEVPRRPANASRRSSGSGKGGGRGFGGQVDEIARKIFQIALVCGLLLLAYLLWGLFSGAWAEPAYTKFLGAAGRLRQLNNIDLVFRGVQIAAFVAVLALLICTWRDTGIGYVLLGLALIFYIGLPFLNSQVYDWEGWKPSHATRLLEQDFARLSLLFVFPGVLWTIGDFVRRFQVASEAAALQRTNLKYGKTVTKQPVVKQKQRFLGRCWEGPYCRDHIREHCPVYVRRSGPCWRYGEGCMCEERIVLQSIISKDWKQQAARADASYSFGVKRDLSWSAKRERCRNCIIYNEHEREKYKALVTIALIAVPVLLVLNGSWLQYIVVQLLAGFEAVTERFSFGDSPTGISFLHGRPSLTIEWILIGALGLVILSQVLRLIEYCCFKIKI